MNRKPSERGASVLYILVIIAFLGGLLSLSLLRQDVGFRHVRDRYLDGVALDMAENGIEYEKANLYVAPSAGSHKRTVGTFANRIGGFETAVSPLENGEWKIVSKGVLKNKSGEVVKTLTVTAKVRKIDSSWRVFERSEGR